MKRYLHAVLIVGSVLSPAFVQSGGVVVMLGNSTERPTFDAGPGGGGNFGAAPPGMTFTCIARNNDRPIITEYSLESGKVLLSVLDLLGSNCLNNLLLYVDSVVQGS